MDGGRVSGAVVRSTASRAASRARRGVVLATGGFGGSVERLERHVRPPLAHAVAFAGAAGDGMRIARAAGAAIEDDHAAPAFWTPVSETAGSTAAAAPIRISRSTAPSPA